MKYVRTRVIQQRSSASIILSIVRGSASIVQSFTSIILSFEEVRRECLEVTCERVTQQGGSASIILRFAEVTCEHVTQQGSFTSIILEGL